MEQVSSRPRIEYIHHIPAKVKQKHGSTTFTQITNERTNGLSADNRSSADSQSSSHPFVLNSKTPSATVFIAENKSEQQANKPGADTKKNGPHVVTIRISNDADKSKVPKISSVHLKSEVGFDSFNVQDIPKKKNTMVKINFDDSFAKASENEVGNKSKAPFICCNNYGNSMIPIVLSSGQCSPSDTLDSGTCSDLDGTPPPLPKKKQSKTSEKAISVTMLSPNNTYNRNDLDYEDNDSNISCDSLNSSELSGSINTEDSHNDCSNRKDKISIPPIAPQMPSYVLKVNKSNSFLPQGLLQDIRDRSAKLQTVGNENKNEKSDAKWTDRKSKLADKNLTSFRQMKNDSPNVLITECTYEERQMKEKSKQSQKSCVSDHFDADKFYEFHLNEKQFGEESSVKSVSEVNAKNDCDDDGQMDSFAGIKDFNDDESPSTIRSSKGTIRGVKNRVRAGIATFLQMQSITKSYKEKDAGKVVLYTTSMGVVRDTYQRCVLVKKILRNLLVKYDERDVFMSSEYQEEVRDRLSSDTVRVPQLFVNGQHIGDADTVEKLNETGELRKMLRPYKSADACTTCAACGGYRMLPCSICRGSKKSLHRNHFTAEFTALKCMNCDEVGLVRCDACN